MITSEDNVILRGNGILMITRRGYSNYYVRKVL